MFTSYDTSDFELLFGNDDFDDASENEEDVVVFEPLDEGADDSLKAEGDEEKSEDEQTAEGSEDKQSIERSEDKQTVGKSEDEQAKEKSEIKQTAEGSEDEQSVEKTEEEHTIEDAEKDTSNTNSGEPEDNQKKENIEKGQKLEDIQSDDRNSLKALENGADLLDNTTDIKVADANKSDDLDLSLKGTLDPSFDDEKITRFVPEGMVVPMDTEEDEIPRQGRQEFLERRRTMSKMHNPSGKLKVGRKVITNREFDVDVSAGDDFDLF